MLCQESISKLNDDRTTRNNQRDILESRGLKFRGRYEFLAFKPDNKEATLKLRPRRVVASSKESVHYRPQSTDLYSAAVTQLFYNGERQ